MKLFRGSCLEGQKFWLLTGIYLDLQGGRADLYCYVFLWEIRPPLGLEQNIYQLGTAGTCRRCFFLQQVASRCFATESVMSCFVFDIVISRHCCLTAVLSCLVVLITVTEALGTSAPPSWSHSSHTVAEQLTKTQIGYLNVGVQIAH